MYTNMAIRFHNHALQRMSERGATKEEVVATIQKGEQFPAKFDRMGFRRNFAVDTQWRGTQYKNKQIEAYAIQEGKDWLVITVITKYF